MVFDFMALFDGLGLIWQASKTDELSKDEGTLSQVQKPQDLEVETRQREKEQAREDRRKQMQKKRQHANTNSRKFRRR